MDTVGGYRLMRRLGSGKRAEVFLGHAGRTADDGSGIPLTAAIKRFRLGAARDSIEREIAALARVEFTRTGPGHLVRLLDLASDVGGVPCLILERLSGGSLVGLLSGRGVIEAGEAVTILAPIAEAVGELHRSGFSHGNISLGNVMFDDRGAPVLIGFGGASPICGSDSGGVTPAMIDADSGVSRDHARLVALVRAVIGQVRNNEEMTSCRALLGWLAAMDSGNAEVEAELTERLFGLADATPLAFGPSEGVNTIQVSGVPGRLPTDHRRIAPSVGSAPALQPSPPSPPAIPRHPLALGVGRWARRYGERHGWLASVAQSIDAILPPIRQALAPVRKRVWIAAGAVAASIVIAFALTQPAGGADARPPAAAETMAPGNAARELAVIEGDDPVLAVDQLLELRNQCFHELSILCLDDVD